MDDIILRYAELPPTVNAVTVVDEEGNFNVYLNTALPREAQERAWQHECRHIRRNHFYHEGQSVSDCEAEAGGGGERSGQRFGAGSRKRP